MKFLLGIFLAVVGLASTAPLDSPTTNGLAIEDWDDFFLELALSTEENDRSEDVQKTLRDRFEAILEQIKNAIDDGRAVKEDLLTKLKEIKGKLKSEVGAKAKEWIHKIKESGRHYLKNILKKLGLSKRSIEERSGPILKNDEKSLEEVQKQLKDRLDEVLKKIKDAIDQGKNVKEDMLKKMKELRKKMKDMNLDLGTKSKEILEKIKEKGRDFLKDILKKLGLRTEDQNALAFLAENETDPIRNLKEKFGELVEQVKEALEGSTTFEEILAKFRDLENYFQLAKEDGILEKIKEKLENYYWKNLKGKLESKRSADIDIFGMIDQLKDLVKEKFNPDRLKEIVEKYLGKGSGAAERLINALKEKGSKRKQAILDWIEHIFEENQD